MSRRSQTPGRPRRRGPRARLLPAVALALSGWALAAPPAPEPQARLVARSVLPASTWRDGTPASGAYFSPEDRATAAANGVTGQAGAAYLPAQPVQGFSSMVPADAGTWWALSDNGFAWRENSADFQLAIYRVDPRWGDAAGPRVLETIVLRDPDRHLPWAIAGDPDSGTRLPDFSFNRMPRAAVASGRDRAARVLTGFDLDPESFVRAPDGTFWIGEEFGPFLVHVGADGRVLEPPVPVPGVRSPQNPYLDLRDRARAERPTLAASRGFEGLAISPDGSTLYALLEGAVRGDDPRDLRIYGYDVPRRAFAERFLRLRLELPSQTVDLAALTDASGARVYPGETAPPAGRVSIGELKSVHASQLLVIERDNLGDGLPAPRFKKVFLLDLAGAGERDGYVAKTPLLDLLAIPGPGRPRGRRRLLPAALLHDRIRARRRRAHAPRGVGQQLPVLERPRPQPERRPPRPSRPGRHGDGPRAAGIAARRRPEAPPVRRTVGRPVPSAPRSPRPSSPRNRGILTTFLPEASMKPGILAVVGLLSLSFLLGRLSDAGDDAAGTVAAKKYRLTFAESALDWAHGGGKPVHGLFLPAQKVAMFLEYPWDLGDDGQYRERPRLHARPADEPDEPVPAQEGEKAKVEDVRVPEDLAREIAEFAALTKRYQDEGYRLGKEVRARLGLEPLPSRGQ